MPNYYLGPWQWKQDEEGGYFWGPPEAAISSIDLRPLDACAARGSHALNFGLFATSKLLDSSYIALGNDLDAKLTTAQADAWRQTLGLGSLGSRKLIEVLWETLTIGADPENARRTLPIMPTSRGILELHFAGALLRSRRFLGVMDVAWPNIQHVIQETYRNLKERADTGAAVTNLHRKLLTRWQQKLGISDYRLFIPDDLPDESPVAPETEVSDDFNRSDEDLSASANWTKVDGDWNVSSNQVWAAASSSGSATFSSARYESDLSGDDQYSQIDWTAAESTYSLAGGACRFKSDAETFYAGIMQVKDGRRQIHKDVAGTSTQLAGDESGGSPPQTIKLEVDGSSLKLYDDGVEAVSTSDATITGNTRIGMVVYWSYANDSHVDNFIGADLAAGETSVPVMMRTYRNRRVA